MQGKIDLWSDAGSWASSLQRPVADAWGRCSLQWPRRTERWFSAQLTEFSIQAGQNAVCVCGCVPGCLPIKWEQIVIAAHRDLSSCLHRPTNEPWSRAKNQGQSDLLYGSKSPAEKWAWISMLKPAESHSPWYITMLLSGVCSHIGNGMARFPSLSLDSVERVACFLIRVYMHNAARYPAMGDLGSRPYSLWKKGLKKRIKMPREMWTSAVWVRCF